MEKKRYYLTKMGMIIAMMFVGMTGFEFIKHFLVPHVTIWQSHIITIVFSTIVAAVTGYFMISKMSSLYLLALKEIEQRKYLQGEIAKISEREKRLLGENLHDGLAQQLTGISYMLQSLVGRIEQVDSELATRLTKILGLVKGVLDQTRNLAKGIYPLELSESGLLDGLEELIANFEEIYKIKCELNYQEAGNWKDLNVDVIRQLYLITQEAINNAIKHGQADYIEVKLISERRNLILTVSDNGKGISDNGDSGIGFSIMAHRAEMIGAGLFFKKNESIGATIECRILKKKVIDE